MIFHCPHCGLKVAPKASDCPNCARRMTRRCPGCSEEISISSTACKYCGETSRSEKTATPAPGIQFLDEAPATPSPSLFGMTLGFAFGTLAWGLLGAVPLVGLLLLKGAPLPLIALTVATAVVGVALPIRLLARGIRFLAGSGAPRWKTALSTAAGAILTLSLVFSAGSFVKTNCFVCAKGHNGFKATAEGICAGKQSHCGRRICRSHKTPMWISLIETMKGRACCMRKSTPAPQIEPVSNPVKKGPQEF